MVRFLKKDVTATQDLSAAALSYTTSFARAFRLDEVILHASENITETVTITLDSINGANYDTVLKKTNINAGKEFVFRSGQSYQSGDEIKVQCTAANTTGIVYLTIKTSEITA